ncbi:MAG: hypothetical protein JSS00_12685 [Proteobacteria bacterium]|nr:hypothetical protein [Pseudomonadota bacterium]
MKHQDGRRDLALIRASGSTARVLNLAHIFERFGDTDEYRDKPLFRSKRLNRALIIKHVVRPSERELFAQPLTTATKVILPYSPTELELGGVSVLVDEIRFEKLLRDAIGGYENEADLAADVELLRMIASLPSFDPFLMRERLRHLGLDPSRVYFDLAEADVQRMRAFVGGEISQLVKLAFATGGPAARDLSQRLADKLMTDETAKALDALRQTLRLSGEEYVEGVFAWKGFLYYKWMTDEFRPHLEAFKPRFADLRIMGASLENRRELMRVRKDILDRVALAAQRVDETLLEYGTAFAALADGQPSAFRSFLIRAPSLFIPIGEAVGVIRHIHSFWCFRFPEDGMRVMDAEEAQEVLQEFDLALSAIEFVQKPAETLAL